MPGSHDRSRRTAAIICPRFPFPPVSGGVKRSLRLAECIERAGLHVVLLTDDHPSLSAVDALTRRGWDTHVAMDERLPLVRRAQQHLLRLPGPRSGEIIRTLGSGALRRRVVTQLEGVIAASHLSLPALTPVIFSTHNVEARLARSAIENDSIRSGADLRQRYHAHRVARTELRAARRTDATICVSEADAEAFSTLAKEVVVAPNGVDDEFFAIPPARSDSEDILFFGQFTYEPNLEGINRFLAEGWPVLARMRPRSRLLIAGEGSRELIDLPPHEPARIVVRGLVEDMPATLTGACLTLVPIWRGGGTRLKVLEALAGMRPVVGTSLGVSGFGFQSGRHGLVAETPAGLARAAAALLGKRERMEAIAAEGRRLAAGYAWERALAPAEELYARYA